MVQSSYMTRLRPEYSARNFIFAVVLTWPKALALTCITAKRLTFRWLSSFIFQKLLLLQQPKTVPNITFISGPRHQIYLSIILSSGFKIKSPLCNFSLKAMAVTGLIDEAVEETRYRRRRFLETRRERIQETRSPKIIKFKGPGNACLWRSRR